jgi:hypothetical protein
MAGNLTSSMLKILSAGMATAIKDVVDSPTALSGTLTLDTAYSNVLRLDPGGANRTVTLPAEAATEGLWFLIANVADAPEWLTVQDDSPATVRILGQGESALFVNEDGSSWRCVELGPKELVYTSVAASTAITGATETETIFDKNVTIPANKLAAGSVVRIRAQGVHTATTGTESHSMLLKVGAVTLTTMATIDPANSDLFYFDAIFVVRTAGEAGTCVATGTQLAQAATGVGTAKPFFLAETAIDTTAAQIVGVYIDRQGTATDSDSARLDILTVEVLN